MNKSSVSNLRLQIQSSIRSRLSSKSPVGTRAGPVSRPFASRENLNFYVFPRTTQSDDPIPFYDAFVCPGRVFLVTTIFCVLGCGYNYVIRGLKGMEMIPCISYFRRCCAKVRPTKTLFLAAVEKIH